MKRIQKSTAFLLAGLVAMVAAPLAMAAGEGNPARGGARNPSNDTRVSYSRETEFIANTTTYGTRLSNKSDNGGGAVYGCRSKPGGLAAGNEPCLRASNLNLGNAFEFATTGVLGGLIQVGAGGDAAKPFTTNATGVATGLNADRVDGKSADDFVAKDGKAADADKLDGRDSTSFASAGSLRSALVSAAGNVNGGRGAASASVVPATNTFTVVFDEAVDTCTFTATEAGGTASGVAFAATVSAGNTKAVQVDEDNDGSPAVPFNLQVIC